jgi:hypothetical protein
MTVLSEEAIMTEGPNQIAEDIKNQVLSVPGIIDRNQLVFEIFDEPSQDWLKQGFVCTMN